MSERRRVHLLAAGLLLLATGCTTHAVAIDTSHVTTTSPATTTTTLTPATTSTSPPFTFPPTSVVTVGETLPADPVAETAPLPPAPGTTTAPKKPASTLPAPKPVTAERAVEQYQELGTIEIPRLGIAKKLLEGVSLNTLDVAPGHWPGTAMPGHQGNVVVAGHRVSHDHPFKYLDRLQPGDEVIFTTADGRFVYHVVSTEIVAPDAVWIIDQTADYTATLFACHPPGSTRQRIVVHLALAA